MGILKRLLIFIGILIVCWTIFYGIVLSLFPDAMNRPERFDVAMRTNFAFVISSQLALLAGTIAAVKLLPHLTSRKNPEKTITIPNIKGFILGSVYGADIISITAITLIVFGKVNIERTHSRSS